jgi:hypothetical protein
LILGKTLEEKEKFTKTNSDKFRITNTGLFDLKVKFDFEKSGGAFTVEPQELELGIDECRDVVVWAFPAATSTQGPRSAGTQAAQLHQAPPHA